MLMNTVTKIKHVIREIFALLPSSGLYDFSVQLEANSNTE